jgi:hypothetical protein
MGGDVEQRVEHGEADRAHRGHKEQALAHDRPVAPDLSVGEHHQQAERAQPAQADQRHGRDLADREPPEHRVGPPTQRGQRQQHIRPPAGRRLRRLRRHTSRQTALPGGHGRRSLDAM